MSKIFVKKALQILSAGEVWYFIRYGLASEKVFWASRGGDKGSLVHTPRSPVAPEVRENVFSHIKDIILNRLHKHRINNFKKA